MNILLVCSYFGPETTVGVNRVNSFVRHWLSKGCSIDVITMPLQGGLPVFLQNQKNLAVHEVPSLFLLKQQNPFPQTKLEAQSNSIPCVRRVFYWLKKNIFANYLDPRLFWWPKAAIVANQICKAKKIDFVLTSVPSYTSHSIGAVLKLMNPSIHWVADYRDLWSGNPIFPGTAIVRWIERLHEQLILKRADLLVTINSELAKNLNLLHGPKRTLVVPNGFESTKYKSNDLDLEEPKKYLSIVYTGTVLTGLQDPEPLFQALTNLIKQKLISSDSIKIEFYGDASAINKTDAFQYLLNLHAIVFKGRVSREASIKAQCTADLLLFLGARPLRGGTDVKGIVSGKIFEYLVSGVEIMAVGVHDQMLVGEMILLASAGDLYNEDVSKIEQRLLELDKNGARKIMPNQEYLDQFDREKQANWLLSEIEKELKS